MGKTNKRKRCNSSSHNDQLDLQGRENTFSSSMKYALTDAQQLKKKLLKKEEVVLVEDFLLKKQKKDEQKTLCSPKVTAKSNVECDAGSCTLSEDTLEDTLEESVQTESLRYYTENSNECITVLFPNQRQKIALEGFAQLLVFCGEVEINGYKINGSANFPVQEYDVFSVLTSSLQYIRDTSVKKIAIDQKNKLESCFRMMFVQQNDIERFTSFLKDIKDVYSCIIIKSMKTLLPPVLKKLNNFNLSSTPKLYPAPFVKPVLETTVWEEILDDFEEKRMIYKGCSCSVMLCGGKDVGKSSMSRYIINGLLNSHESVFYLECDCGQTEFTPPAVLSLVKVTKPLFGPPFSHLTNPSYYYEHLNEGPLVINQQGWVRGLGLSLLIDVINLTSPCYIVQINSSMESRNLVSDLSDSYLSGEVGWSVDPQQARLKQPLHPCTYKKIECPGLLKDLEIGKKKSFTSRNLAISSYFSKLFQPDFDVFCLSTKNTFEHWIPPSLSTLYPWCVAWKDVAVHVIHEKISDDVILYAMNMSVVCLAAVEHDSIYYDENMTEPLKLRDKPRGEFLGLGIVRNIDPINKLFYILTPEASDTLEQVNALLKGNIQLPPQFLQEDGYSSHPYFCYDYINLSSKAASGMKPRFNLKRKPSKMKNSFVEKS